MFQAGLILQLASFCCGRPDGAEIMNNALSSKMHDSLKTGGVVLGDSPHLSFKNFSAEMDLFFLLFTNTRSMFCSSSACLSKCAESPMSKQKPKLGVIVFLMKNKLKFVEDIKICEQGG